MEQALTRREWWPLAAAAALTGFAGFYGGRQAAPLRGQRAPVYISPAGDYSEDLSELLRHGLESTGLDVEGRKVLLLPQLAEAAEASTHPAVVAAVHSVMRERGAAQVWIGGAAGGDARARAEALGYRELAPEFDAAFVDLRSGPQVPLAGFLGREIPVAEAAAKAELVISLGKLRTDVRHGVAASITNLFNVAPQWRGRRGAQAAVELVRLMRPVFGIVDGIVGIEGNGPEAGSSKRAGVLVLGPDLVAVDATCARIIGQDPWEVPYLEMAADRQGVVEAARIDQVGAPLDAVRTVFRKAERRPS